MACGSWTPQFSRQYAGRKKNIAAAAHVYTIGLLVRSEEGVWDWGLDHFNLAALGICCAGQPVVGIQ